MILEIVKYGNPVLRAKGKPVEEINNAVSALAANMVETMRAANGVGLAAQQVGKALQMMVLDVPEMDDRPSTMTMHGKQCDFEKRMPMVLLNPQLELSKDREIGIEGCLSFPEITADIMRSESVKARAQLLDGSWIEFEATGLLARALQHEVDHLNGILFIDRMNSATKTSLSGRLKRMQRETAESL